MLRLSVRNLLLNKLRLFLTLASVTVGVAFIAGTFVLSDTVGKAFDELYAGLTSGVDVTVRAESAFDDVSTQGQVRPLDDGLVAVVRDVPGVAVAEGSVAGFALILDRDGEPIQPGGAPTLGVSVGSDEQLAGDFSIRQGQLPEGPEEVVLDAASAEKAGFRVGDDVDIVLQNERATFTMVGTTGFGESDSLAGATLAGFDLETAQRLLDKVGKVDEIGLRAEPGVSASELRDEVAQVLPDGVTALTGEQVASQGSAAVREGLGVFTQVLMVFAGVSLLVGSFVIWNTFSILVAQRRREVGLLRAVGATRRQILGGVMVEAALIGLTSAVLGLVVGVGLASAIRELLKVIGVEIPTTAPAVEPRTIAAALVVGLLVTVVAALAPAVAATRVTPMEALREAVPTTGEVGRSRTVTGWVLLGTGLAGLVACAVVGDQLLLTGVATLVAFAGLLTAGPSLARGTARLAEHGKRGSGWRLAARNIARASRRSAATALALAIGLSVVSAVAVTASSMKVSVGETVTAGNRSDLILQPGGAGIGISPVVADLVRAREDVGTVVELRGSSAKVDGEIATVVGIEPSGLEDVVDLGVRDGSIALGPGQLLMATDEADSLGVTVGDDVDLVFPETGRRTMTVAATFTQDTLLGSSYLMSLEEYAEHVTSPLDAAILLTGAPGVDPTVLETSVTKALSDYPNVTVSNPDELTADAQAAMNQLLGLVTALLLLAVVVAILGVINTLVLSVFERTRELGLMRAVGATQRQVRGVVRRESVLMSLLGAVTGLGLGMLAGTALSRALDDQGVTHVAVPAGTLAAYLVAAALVGVLAAIGPARRASRVDVLQAITVE